MTFVSDFTHIHFFQFVSYVLLFIALWTVAVFTEVTIAAVSLRGTIYNDGERAAQEYLLYVRLGEIRSYQGCKF